MNPSELYGLRVLVFFETSPQSNKYNQVIFTADEYKKLTDCIGSVVEKADENGVENRKITTSNEIYFLPDLRESE